MNKNKLKKIIEDKLSSATKDYLAEQYTISKISLFDGSYPTKILNLYQIIGEIMAYRDLLSIIEIGE